MIYVFVMHYADIVGYDDYQVIIEATVHLSVKNIVLKMKKKNGCLWLKKKNENKGNFKLILSQKDNSLKPFKYMSA